MEAKRFQARRNFERSPPSGSTPSVGSGPIARQRCRATEPPTASRPIPVAVPNATSRHALECTLDWPRSLASLTLGKVSLNAAPSAHTGDLARPPTWIVARLYAAHHVLPPTRHFALSVVGEAIPRRQVCDGAADVTLEATRLKAGPPLRFGPARRKRRLGASGSVRRNCAHAG